ncbi:MAG: YHYH protein [Candidatus Sericytochromatia bacterium]
MKKYIYKTIISLLVINTACSVNNQNQAKTSNNTNNNNQTNASQNTPLSLDNCTTSFGDNVPDFYKTYFKCSDIKVEGENVIIKTTGLPPYKTYYYGSGNPNYTEFDYSRGSEYKPNPNKIQKQDVTLTIPLNPITKNSEISKTTVNGQVGGTNNYPMGTAGVSLNSVLLFNPLAAPGDNIEDEKYTFDDYNSHAQQNGQYHYHTSSKGPLEVLKKAGFISNTEPGKAEIELYGVMCDGSIIMGCTELDGSKPDPKNLDAQNGHVHDISNKDKKVLLSNRYHTHICPSNSEFSHKFTPQIQYYNTCQMSGVQNGQQNMGKPPIGNGGRPPMGMPPR